MKFDDLPADIKQLALDNKHLVSRLPEPRVRSLADAALIGTMVTALKAADEAINPPDIGGISMHEWNQRLKAATDKVRAALAKAKEV